MRQQWLFSRTIARVIGCCLVLAVAVTVHSQETADELTIRGREALGAGRYEEAIELFAKASSETSDRDTKDRLLFYRAVTYQRMAEGAEGDRRQGLLHRSARLYDAYLEARPDSGAATNNLAKVYAALGWNDTAAELFEQALAKEDDKQGLYLKNYAQFLDDAGEWEEATELWSRIVQEQPLSPALQKSMVERFGEAGIEQLAGYLWELLEAGYARQAARSALDALADGGGKARDRIELLTIVSVALSRIHYEPAEFTELELAGRLTELGSDPDIGRGALDIEMLHDVEALDPRRYGWWAEKTDEYEDPPRGVWPADGFRALVRSLGSRYKQIGEPGRAESYYRLAADLRPYDVDPGAIRDLTQLYIEENQLPKVNLLAEEYEDRLFRGKGGAYRKSRLRKIFEYHRTLGVLYATIGRWGDSSQVDSAIFQLEHAQDKSREVEERTESAVPENYRFSPDMVNMLATGYVATEQPLKSYQLRVDEAERFQKQGDEEAVRKVLEPIKTQELPVGLRSRIDGLAVSPATTATAATTATTATMAPARTVSSEVVAVDRLRRAAAPTIRIDLSRSRTRLPLSEEELDLVAAQLQKNLGRDVTDAASLDWGDAPGTPRELYIEDGGGVLVLQLDGNTHKIPFQVISEGSPVAPR